MSESERPRSPFAGMADLTARTPVRVLSPDEIERMLAEHRLYLETEYHQGHRANFSSADLTGRDFSGLNLRGVKMDRAVRCPDQERATQPGIAEVGSVQPCMTKSGATQVRLAEVDPGEHGGIELSAAHVGFTE